MRLRTWGWNIAALTWVTIGLATLQSQDASTVTAQCLACEPGWLADVLANLLLFMPLGVGLTLAGLNLPRTALLVIGTTLGVELLQFSTVTGRDASVVDLVANSSGGLIGALVIRGWRPLLFPSPTRAAILAWVWALLWSAGTTAAAWALQPSLPDSLWWAHWSAGTREPTRAVNGPHPAPIVGSVWVGDDSLTPGRLDDWPTLRSRLLAAEPIRLQVVLRVAPRGSDRSIVRIDDADTELPLIEFREIDRGVSFFFRTRTAALRLRGPTVWTGPVLVPGRVDTLTVTGLAGNGVLRLDLQSARHRSTWELRLTPNLGWRFMVPYRNLPVAEPWLSMLWIVVMVWPVGWWARRGARHVHSRIRQVSLAALALPPILLMVLPVVYEVAWPAPSEWLALAVGVSVGWWASVRSPAGRRFTTSEQAP